MRQLAVFLNDSNAGILTEQSPGKGYSFQYDESYLNSTLPPISATLPKQKEIFNSEQLFPFFSNMIPEGANRKVICRTQRIDENDFFGILETMANRDFIGAVNIRRIDND